MAVEGRGWGWVGTVAGPATALEIKTPHCDKIERNGGRHGPVGIVLRPLDGLWPWGIELGRVWFPALIYSQSCKAPVSPEGHSEIHLNLNPNRGLSSSAGGQRGWDREGVRGVGSGAVALTSRKKL